MLPPNRTAATPSVVAVAKIRGVKPEFWTDEDVCELSIPARLLFIGLWNFACDNGHLQDKPKQIKRRILPDDEVNCADLLREIEAQGLIERTDGWICIPNLAKHQKPHKRWWATCEKPGCTVPEGKSHAPSNRGATVAHPLQNGGATGGHGCATADGDCDGDVEGDGDKEPSSEVAIATPRPEVTQLCDHLANAIEANGSKRPTIGKNWHDAARLMLDRDNRTAEQVHAAIDWCQSDEFWRSNILSMPKLREKYDQLRLAATRSTGTVSRKQAETDQLFERAAARMNARNAS